MRSLFAVLALITPLLAKAELIVVEDLGGASALPYYRALNLLPDNEPSPLMTLPPIPVTPYDETDMLPVKSERLTPGPVVNRALNASGLQPLFLIGDDPLSREWLTARGETLRELNAVGLVVNVEKLEALNELRQLADGLEIAPASGDQLAEMIGISHYPVLITSTGMEQ
ncbi:integrating conjugative element protein [Pseudomonas sp. NA-150]|uniref:integrating conjugative element protein n=1 Tax=Pseudomonas sp. NA-150 TaxID=3367525 RepID=UPI0037CC92DB